MFSRLLEPRLVRLAKPVRGGLALAVASGLAAGIFTVLQARALSLAVNAVFLDGATLAGIRAWLLALVAWACGRALAMGLSEIAAARVAGKVKSALRERLVNQLLSVGPAQLRRERTGELVNSLVEGVDTLDAYFGQYLPQLALAAVVPVTILCFTLPLDPLSGVVLLATAPLIPLFMMLISNLAETATARQWSTLSRLSAHFLDALQGLVTLKLFNRSRHQVAIVAQVSEQYRQATMSVLRVAFLSALTLELVATLSTAVVAVQIGLRLLYGRLPFDQALFILILAPEFYLPLRLLGTRFHAGIAGSTAARRLFAILAHPPAVPNHRPADGNAAAPVSATTPPVVAFNDVHFRYADGERPALDSLSLTIMPGEVVALVGPSGGGKSTIASLLLGFAKPSAGAITIDGSPMIGLPIEAWRQHISWVPQLPYLFDGTVADNIRLACAEAPREAVIAAAQRAQAHDFIMALPMGYETPIGERGNRLSGGQTQRIALARAFLRDSPLVILDEATAHLDVESETRIQESIAALLRGRSALIIAHRLDTARRAGRIVYVDQGRVMASGTHGELMAQEGPYWSLVRAYCDENGTPIGPGPLAEPAPSAAAASRPERAIGPDLLETPHPPAWRRLATVLRPAWAWMLLAMLLGFGTIASNLGLMGASAWLIASAALQPSIAELQVAIVAVRFFGLARGLLRYAERLASHDVTLRLLSGLRSRFFASIEPLVPAIQGTLRGGDLFTRAVNDIATLQEFFVRAVTPPVVALLVGVALWAFLARFSVSLAAVVVLALVLSGVALPLAARALGRRDSSTLGAGRARLTTALVELVQGCADLLAFGRGGDYANRVRRLSLELVGRQERLARLAALQAAGVVLLSGLTLVALLAVATPLVHAGTMTGVWLAVVLLVSLGGFEAVLPLPMALQTLDTGLEAAHRLFGVADAARPAPDPAVSPVPAQRPSPPAPELFRSGRGIGFQDVSFAYGPADPLALAHISFELPVGAHAAIVGPSGGGKTTLFHLLLRLWEPQDGAIWLDGRPLAGIDPEQVRHLIGVVPQQPHLFNVTVRENLLLARPDASEDMLERAARLAQIHETIRSWPSGYDTVIGEAGLRLSGGERQRLAIARALLREPSFLLLDEPASHLDALTELALHEALHTHLRGRTRVVITHRLVRMEAYDVILVMRAGILVEQGSHAGLLARRADYWRMWSRQAETQALDGDSSGTSSPSSF